MKKILAFICMALIIASLIGCSKDVSKQGTEELGEEMNTEMQVDSNTNDNKPNNNRIEVATYAGGKEFQLIIEKDKTKEVVKGVPIHYLSLKYSNGEKKLLAQSIDRKDDWTNSIAKILSPTMSNDGKKVYYSTDNTFTRTNGYGAKNYRTRVVDIHTLKDSYFEEGALVAVLNNNHGSYKDHLVLELNSVDSAGKPTMVYQVVKPNGEQLVVLDTAGNWQTSIDAKLSGSQSSNSNTEIGGGVRLSGFVNENFRGEQINYDEYSAVIIPFYSGQNSNKLGKTPYLDHPDGKVLDFAVFGKLQDVVITRYENMEDSGKKDDYGMIENTILNIHSRLPSDMSYYKITGKVQTGEGVFKDVVFSLDDMRSASDYNVILVR